VTALWVTTLAASVGCYGLKLAGVSLPGSVLSHPRVQRIAGLLPVAMLSALVATDLFDANQHYSADWRTLAEVGAGALALWRGRSLVVVFVVAIATTAVLRALNREAFHDAQELRRCSLANLNDYWRRWPRQPVGADETGCATAAPGAVLGRASRVIGRSRRTG